ncbi:hypothetical protein NQ315_012613, partial [Exocentrus adspersus]
KHRAGLRQLKACLKQRPVQNFLDYTKLLYGYDMAPITPFGPVIEKASVGILSFPVTECLANDLNNAIPNLAEVLLTVVMTIDHKTKSHS